MSLSYRDNLRRVREEFMTRRGEAFEESESRKLALYPLVPGLREIDTELAHTSMKIMEATVSGGDIRLRIDALRSENRELRNRRRELLEAAGYTADYTDIKYRCAKCGDTGFVGVDMCDCMKRELTQAMLEGSGVGRLSRTQSFESFSLDYYKGAAREEMEYNLTSLRSFASGFDSHSEDSWLLIGATGLGKTHLSTAVATEVIRRGYDVVYDTIQTVTDTFADEQFRNKPRDESRRYMEADLLIVDDLGAELTNQFTVACLYNLINTRINSRRPTIFSTNLTQKELRERYADRITSRLFGEYKPLLFSGTDVRRQKLES